MFLDNPVGYDPDRFKAFIATMKWRGWRPKFIVLHNTAEPNLRQWENGPNEHQRIVNLNHYYKTLGWHSGPHLFISPTLIWNACDLEQDGVSVSCWNHLALGIEMVGDYETESFISGNGAKVRDLTVVALAILHKALGIDPGHYVQGVSGLHFHKECVRDHHDCPGKNVDKVDLISRVLAEMAKI